MATNMNHNIFTISIAAFCLSVLWLCTAMLKPAFAQNGAQNGAQHDEKLHPIANQKKFIIYYSDVYPDDEFANYDVIVFDREAHPPLGNLNSKGKVILGYISGGELDSGRSDFEQIKQNQILLEENPNWKGSFIVDVRRPSWTAHVIEDVIPEILRKGFDGIFIDTLDSVEDLEVRHPEKYKGMIEGTANMIKTIRMHYPNMKIMVNRGYKVLPHIAREIDYVLAEGTLAEYDFKTGKSKLFADAVYQEYAGMAEKLKVQAPHLQIMAVDYWDMEDIEGVKKIYQKHRENGFIPYVTTIDLEKVHHQPW